ncbi:hypothetical protein SLEP1_g20640 [Rubroshorea leprosula]|uniref:Uncharacterized protein n=1 Tax=Rubroshorea leprosula TaxID=152421 RepID=A0AAV5JCI5_9ROSI|nr:hypothetical protein SLEP1_g20640 [Rubroshorea leprosula]
MVVNPSTSGSILTFASGSVSVLASGSIPVTASGSVLVTAFSSVPVTASNFVPISASGFALISASGFVSSSASGSVPIFASNGSSVDDAGVLPSSSEPEFFDIFRLPLNADGKFVVKGALCHVEKDPVVPSIPTEVPLISSSKGGKVVLPLGSTKVFCDLDKVSWVTSSCDVDEIREIYRKNLMDLQVLRTTIVEVLLSVDDYKAVHKFVTEPSVSIAELIVRENLIDAGVWVPGSCDSYSDFLVPLVPSSFEGSPKPERSLKRKTSEKSPTAIPSSFLGFADGINTFAILSRSAKIEKLEKVDRTVKTEKILAEEVEKAAGKSKGVVPQRAPLVVRRSKRLKSTSFKATSTSGSDKGVAEGCVIEVDKEVPASFVFPDDELQQFFSEGRLLISSFMDFIVRKSFSKPLTRLPLKDVVRPDKEDSSYRAAADLSEMRERSKDLLNLCRQLHFEKTTLRANSIEVERLKKELTMLQECYDLLKKEKELFSSSTAAEKASLESSVLALQRQLGDLSSVNSALERSVSDLKVQVSSLQASFSSIIQSFKESLEGKAFALSSSLGYFNLAVKLIKLLLPRRGLIVSDRLAEFKDMDVAALIHADPDLKRTYDQGPSAIFLDDSPRQASEGTGSSWDVGDSAIAVYSRGSSVDVEVS